MINPERYIESDFTPSIRVFQNASLEIEKDRDLYASAFPRAVLCHSNCVTSRCSAGARCMRALSGMRASNVRTSELVENKDATSLRYDSVYRANIERSESHARVCMHAC